MRQPFIDKMPEDLVREMCAKDLPHDDVRALACVNKFHADEYRKMKELPGLRPQLLAKAPLTFEFEEQQLVHKYWDTLDVAVDADTIVTGCRDGVVGVWDRDSGGKRYEYMHHIKSQQEIDEEEEEEGEGEGSFYLKDILQVASVETASDIIASGGYDGIVKVLEKDTGVLRHTLNTNQDGVPRAIRSIAIDHDTIAIGGDRGFLSVWNRDTGELHHVLEGHIGMMITGVAMGSGIIVSQDWSGMVNVWRKDTGEFLHTFQDAVESDFNHSHVVIAASNQLQTWPSLVLDADTILTTINETIYVRNKDSGELIYTIDTRSHIYNRIYSLAAGADLIVSGHHNGTINIWNKDTGDFIQALGTSTFYSTLVHSVALNVSDSFITIVGSYGSGEVKVWRGRRTF
jgi:WD40 repeat protein